MKLSRDPEEGELVIQLTLPVHIENGDPDVHPQAIKLTLPEGQVLIARYGDIRGTFVEADLSEFEEGWVTIFDIEYRNVSPLELLAMSAED